MLKRLFRGRLADPELDDDPAFDDFDLRAARDRARAGEWQAARDVLHGADHEVRGRRFAVLAEAAAADESWLLAWDRAEPGHPDAAILMAAHLMAAAGRARGAASAKHTTAEQFAGFASFGAAARAASRRAIELAPADPAPWYGIVSSMLTGNGSMPEFNDAMREGLRRDRYHFELHLAAVTYLCRKWYGSHEKMFAAARKAADGAPAGASVHVLPVFAHFEYAMREYCWDTRSPEAFLRVCQYFGRRDVAAEVDACAERFRAAGPRRLGRAPTAYSWLALAGVLGGRPARARAAFAELLPYRAGTGAWGYFYLDGAGGFLTGWSWAHR
ncbi:hypothetical protein ACPPVO_46035 [Dactylosporangium sp. McL0621]|uniref:hypothetical protein n=1 Tax=Dactylosporangium sp. McL0621 TaxID=3415678 RepID=UPI003CF3BD6C